MSNLNVNILNQLMFYAKKVFSAYLNNISTFPNHTWLNAYNSTDLNDLNTLATCRLLRIRDKFDIVKMHKNLFHFYKNIFLEKKQARLVFEVIVVVSCIGYLINIGFQIKRLTWHVYWKSLVEKNMF